MNRSLASRHVRIFAGTVGVLVLVAAHLEVAQRGAGYSGPMLVLDHLYALVVAAAVFAVCEGLGRVALRFLGAKAFRPLEELVFAVPLGAGVLSLAMLLFGMIGLLRPFPVLALLGTTALIARRELRGGASLIRQSLGDAKRRNADGALGMLAVVVVVLVAVFMLAFALAPPVDWDTLMYHLRVPAQFLERGRVYLPEDNLRVSYVNVVHMLYLPLLAAGSSAGPAVLSVLFALLLAAGVYTCCDRFFPRPTGALAVGLLWGTTTLLITAITPRVDVTVAVFLFLAHYALLIGWSDRDRGALWVAAIVLGLSVGVKFHALPYILALSPVVVWAAFRCTDRNAHAVRLLLGFGGLVFSGAAPWLMKNWILLGAPLYPLLSEPLVLPWMRPLLGSRTVPADVDSDVLRIIWRTQVPFNLSDAFFNPGRISIEAEGHFYYANRAFLFVPAALLLVRDRIVQLLLLPALAYLVILLVPFPETNLRYLAPAVAPLTIVVAHLAVRAAGRGLAGRGVRQAVLVMLVLAALLPSLDTMSGWLGRILAVEHAVGLRSANDYVASHRLAGVASYGALTRVINDSVPPSGRLLLLFEDRGYHLRPGVLQDHKATTWPLIGSHVGTDDCLSRAGITHVLFARFAVRLYLGVGSADSTMLRLREFEDFAGRCLELVHQTASHELYRISTRTSEAAAKSAPTR